jgi:hypothetical protein
MHPSPAKWLVVLVTLVSAGCSDDSGGGAGAPATGPSPAARPAVDRAINQFLLQAALDHHLAARMEGDWVVFDGCPVAISAGASPEQGGKDMVIVQVDYRVRLPDGRLVVQQLVGWGDDREKAVATSEVAFLLGTFHTVLGAFVDPAEEHVQKEKRTIGGRERVLTLGDTVTKVVGGGSDEAHNKPQNEQWSEQLLSELTAAPIPAGAHWVDVYNGFVDDHQEIEIQLDNKRWSDMEQKMRGAHWPKAGRLTSVRKFIVVQDADDPTRPKQPPRRTPDTAPSTTSVPAAAQ